MNAVHIEVCTKRNKDIELTIYNVVNINLYACR